MEQHSVHFAATGKKIGGMCCEFFFSQKCHLDNGSDAVLNHRSWKIVKLDDVANNLNLAIGINVDAL
jgi:hypothetical protein